MSFTFLHPRVDVDCRMAISITTPSKHEILISEDPNNAWSPVYCNHEGFSSRRDGTIVFAAKCDPVSAASPHSVIVGFSSYDGKGNSPTNIGQENTALWDNEGIIWEANGKTCQTFDYLSSETRQSKEVVCILTISNNGATKSVQFIVDGNEGAVLDCESETFDPVDKLFPVVKLWNKGDRVTMIPFNEVKSRSPRIDELRREFEDQKCFSKNLSAHVESKQAAALSVLRQQLKEDQRMMIEELKKKFEERIEALEEEIEEKDKA